jgi:hypothetical protein
MATHNSNFEICCTGSRRRLIELLYGESITGAA